mmetsp:Transcript_27177/g.44920  ORF Transcript_27177/g.44920 Transcript_27177/m.44920 type:complete len:86 (-) Transcript_27177:707-964(-)
MECNYVLLKSTGPSSSNSAKSFYVIINEKLNGYDHSNMKQSCLGSNKETTYASFATYDAPPYVSRLGIALVGVHKAQHHVPRLAA